MDEPTSLTVAVNPDQIKAYVTNENLVLVTVEVVPMLPSPRATKSVQKIEQSHCVFVVELDAGERGVFHEEFRTKEEVKIFILGARAAAFPREFKALPREWEPPP